MWPMTFWGRLLPSAALVLPPALIGWAIANLVVFRRLEVETLLLVPVPVVAAVVVVAGFSKPGTPVIKWGRSQR